MAAVAVEAPKWNILGAPNPKEKAQLRGPRVKSASDPATVSPAVIMPPDSEDDEPSLVPWPFWHRSCFWVGDRWVPAMEIWSNPFC